MRLTVRIVRLENNAEHGTFGALIVAGSVFCWTLEPTWRENKTNISCIPTGQYLCRIRQTRNHGMAYEVQDVPGRSAVLIHPGNTDDDTQACILPGLKLGYVGSRRGILESKRAYDSFMELMLGEKEFHLTITESF